MINKIFILKVTIFCLLFLYIVGCKGKIHDSNDREYKARFIGKKFIIYEDFFVIKYFDDVISENMISVCGRISAPKKEAFLKKEIKRYRNYEILHVKNGGEKFVITNIQGYSRGPSAGFIFFTIRSLSDRKLYFVRKGAYSHGLKHGYIKEIDN